MTNAGFCVSSVPRRLELTVQNGWRNTRQWANVCDSARAAQSSKPTKGKRRGKRYVVLHRGSGRHNGSLLAAQWRSCDSRARVELSPSGGLRAGGAASVWETSFVCGNNTEGREEAETEKVSTSIKGEHNYPHAKKTRFITVQSKTPASTGQGQVHRSVDDGRDDGVQDGMGPGDLKLAPQPKKQARTDCIGAWRAGSINYNGASSIIIIHT